MDLAIVGKWKPSIRSTHQPFMTVNVFIAGVVERPSSGLLPTPSLNA
jgi:hypothetical protein